MTEILKKYAFAICSVLVFIALKYFSPEIFPDYLNLSSLDSSNYFELIISSTASIFGILIAVILLTFEFVKQAAFRRKNKNILTKAIVTNLVSTAISVIVLSLFSYSTIPDFKQSNSLSIGYFLGFLFVGFIISIFPATKEILETANTLKETNEEIQSLSVQNLGQISTLQFEKFNFKNSELSVIKIRHELLNSVRECDYEAYVTILEKLNNKAIALIDKGENRQLCDTVFNGVTFLWSSGNFEALRVGNLQFYETIWECIEELYEFAAKEKIYLLHYQQIEFFLRDFIKFLSRNKLGDSLSSGVKVLSNIFKQNLKFNCPTQEKLTDLYDLFEKETEVAHDIYSSIQWDEINSLVNLINDIQISAIENIDKELFDTCRREFEYTLRQINHNDFPNIKIYQEAYIAIRLISHQTYNGFRVNEERLFEESWWTFNIDTGFITDVIKKERFYVGRILEDISDYIIKSQRKERLDDFFSLNYWGALGRHISKFYSTNTTANKAMEFILCTFEKLKEEIEARQLPNQAKNYNEIKKQIQSLKTYLLKDNQTLESPVIKKIDKVLSEFKEVIEPTDFRIVKWRDVANDTPTDFN